MLLKIIKPIPLDNANKYMTIYPILLNIKGIVLVNKPANKSKVPITELRLYLISKKPVMKRNILVKIQNNKYSTFFDDFSILISW
jgi:hypothetical protein